MFIVQTKILPMMHRLSFLTKLPFCSPGHNYTVEDNDQNVSIFTIHLNSIQNLKSMNPKKIHLSKFLTQSFISDFQNKSS